VSASASSARSVLDILSAFAPLHDTSRTALWARFVARLGFETDLCAHANDIGLENYALPSQAGGGDDVVVGGYGRLVHALAQGLDTQLGRDVVAIDCSGSDVRVICRDGSEHRGSHAVVTVPLGVLKAEAIAFSPPLSAPRLRSIQALGFGAFEKVVLQFARRFWADDETSADPFTGLLIRGEALCPYWIDLSAFTGVPTLAAHVAGPAQRALVNVGRAGVERHCLDALSRALGQALAPCTVTTMSDWGGDPFSRGAYTRLRPGNVVSNIVDLAQVHADQVHFAGEATSTNRYGYADGAYDTGLRAATALLRWHR
jgi:polyamine oxidase